MRTNAITVALSHPFSIGFGLPDRFCTRMLSLDAPGDSMIVGSCPGTLAAAAGVRATCPDHQPAAIAWSFCALAVLGPTGADPSEAIDALLRRGRLTKVFAYPISPTERGTSPSASSRSLRRRERSERLRKPWG